MPDYLVTFDAVEKTRCVVTVSEKSIGVKEHKECVSSQPLLTYSEIVEALNRGDVLYNHSYKEYYWIDTLHIPNLGDTKVLLCLGYPENNDIVHGVHRYELSKLEGTACIITVYKSKSEETNNEAVSV